MENRKGYSTAVWNSTYACWLYEKQHICWYKVSKHHCDTMWPIWST